MDETKNSEWNLEPIKGAEEDAELSYRLSRARKYYLGQERFKETFYSHERASGGKATPTRWGQKASWIAAACVVALLISIPIKLSESPKRVEAFYCNEDCTLEEVELLLNQSIIMK